MQISFAFRYSLGSPRGVSRSVNEPYVAHCRSSVTKVCFRQRLRADSNWHRGIDPPGNFSRRTERSAVCGLSRNRRTRSKSIEATWTSDETIVLSRSVRGSAASVNSASKRIDNNSAEAASAKDLTLWTLAWQSLPYRAILTHISVNIRAYMTFNNAIEKLREKLVCLLTIGF